MSVEMNWCFVEVKLYAHFSNLNDISQGKLCL
jgi:hypothetical protein